MNGECNRSGGVFAADRTLIESTQFTETRGARAARNDIPLTGIAQHLARAAAVVLIAVAHGGPVLAAPQRLPSAFASDTANGEAAMSGQEMFTLNGHTDWVRSVAFSADGKRLASGSSDQTVKVWDVTPRAEEDGQK